jgi:hypothetical protein
MSRKVLPLGMLLTLIVAGQLLSPASALAQVSPSPSPTPTPESIKVFSAGGKTIGGPGDFTGPCGSETEILHAGTKPVCVTVENTGDCQLSVVLLDSGGAPLTRDTVAKGAAKTSCSDKPVFSIHITCSAGNGTCRFRWRIDDNSE